MNTKRCVNDPEELNVIAQVVSGFTGISIERLMDKTRKKEVNIARQTATYFMTKKTKASLDFIGKYFNRGDHSVAINSRDSIQDLIDTDKAFRQDLIRLELEIDRVRQSEISPEVNNNLSIYNESKSSL
jgi:chromosomal replication initiator protein